MSEFPVGHASHYPSIGGIPITLHMGGYHADGSPMDGRIVMGSGDRPRIHMNSAAVAKLGALIEWKECPKENDGQPQQD